MKLDWLKLFETIIGVGEMVVPVFIHNPNSQKIEAVVVTNLNTAMNLLNQGAATSTTK